MSVSVDPRSKSDILDCSLSIVRFLLGSETRRLSLFSLSDWNFLKSDRDVNREAVRLVRSRSARKALLAAMELLFVGSLK